MRNSDLAGAYAPYYEYIMHIVGGEEWWDQLGDNMLRLFERKYYWKHPIDENWKEHVNTFRANAMRSVLPIYILPGEPSVLEVLVCLTIRVGVNIMYTEDTDYVERLPEYFNDIIRELCFDCDFSGIDSAIDDFLESRTALASDGDRRLTLWEQANIFFQDQFDIENG